MLSNNEARRLAKTLLKGGILFLSIIAIIIFARIFDLSGILDPAWADVHLKDQGATGILLYVALTAVLSSIPGVPRQAVSVLGGYAFGALFGTLWVSIGLTLGCAGGFFYARLLGRSALQKRFGPRIRTFDAFLSRSPFGMTVAVRFFPVGSNALTNLLAGITSIPPLPFISGSALGYLPQSVIFALLGSGIRVDPFWRTLTAALLFILASILGYVLYRRYRGEALVDKEE